MHWEGPPPDEARTRQLLEWGQRAENRNDKDRAISLYRQALAGCRQIQRGPSLGQRLKALLNKRAPAAPPDPLLEACEERLARSRSGRVRMRPEFNSGAFGQTEGAQFQTKPPLDVHAVVVQLSDSVDARRQ